jgi:hypothetical protein
MIGMYSKAIPAVSGTVNHKSTTIRKQKEVITMDPINRIEFKIPSLFNNATV